MKGDVVVKNTAIFLPPSEVKPRANKVFRITRDGDQAIVLCFTPTAVPVGVYEGTVRWELTVDGTVYVKLVEVAEVVVDPVVRATTSMREEDQIEIPPVREVELEGESR